MAGAPFFFSMNLSLVVVEVTRLKLLVQEEIRVS
jgi:hypothetical protein